MATSDTSHAQRNWWKGLTRVLKSAACECFLIVLLFIDAAFSYFLTRFAQYCELQVPCILCSRLDHVFRNEKPGYHWNLFCSSHRSEISSLISCNIHGKLVDGRGMCENCLSSHIEENKSDSDMQRVSLGKLGIDPAGFGNCDSQTSSLSRDSSPASKCARLRSCCNKPLTPKPNAQRLPPLKSRGVAVAKTNLHLPRRLRGRNGTKKIKDKFSAPAVTHIGKTGFDPSSHVGYTDLKISSESEPEIPFSDDEGSNCMVHDMNESKKESLIHSAPETPSKRLYSSLANDSHYFRCLHSGVLSEDDVGDCKEQLADQKTNRSVLPKLISLDDIPAASSCLVEVPSYSASLPSDVSSLVDKSSSVDVTEKPAEGPSGKLADVTEASKNENISIDNNDQTLKPMSTSTGAGFKTDQAVDDNAVVHSTDEDPSAVHTSPFGGEEKGTSVSEPTTYNNGVNEDRSLPIQNSSAEVHSSFNNFSPELQGNTDDFDETTDESNPYGVQSFGNYFTERSEFGSLGDDKDHSLPVQNSSGEGIHLSPELQGNTDDFDEMTDESNPYGVQSFGNYFTERSEFGSLGDDKDHSFPVQNSSGEGIHLSPELQGNTDDFDDTTDESNPYGVQSFGNYFTERSEFGSLGDDKDDSLPVQNSSGEGIHLRGPSDDFETTDESNPYQVQSFHNHFVTERSDFGTLDSLVGSTFNEIEGEDPVDRLKRLVEHYRKCIDALYRELEEERNASAVATNQAMAMITRLQEEKSALQMESLQYLRLMEEQADHDGDALDKANDLLSEREKELQDLEAELDFYRSNFTDETQMETLAKASINSCNGHVSVDNTSTSVRDDLNFPSKAMFSQTSDHNDNRVAKSAWSEFEDEKFYISERLQNLERKVRWFAHHGTSPHISNGEYLDEAANGGQRQQQFFDEQDEQATCEVEGNDLPLQEASLVSNGSAPCQESSSTSISKDQVVSKGNSHMVSNGQKGSEDCNEIGLPGLEIEISVLNKRLEALMADCKFLEHSLKSLQNGNEGIGFIQEILHELRELRKLEIRSWSMSVS